jgi:hypothetical protein
MNEAQLHEAFKTMTPEDQEAYRCDLIAFGTARMKQVGDHYVRVPPDEPWYE